MKYRDLREFMDGLARLGEFRRVSAPVSARLEMTALADAVLRAGGPAPLFEKPEGAAMPFLAHLVGTKRRGAPGVGGDASAGLC